MKFKVTLKELNRAIKDQSNDGKGYYLLEGKPERKIHEQLFMHRNRVCSCFKKQKKIEELTIEHRNISKAELEKLPATADNTLVCMYKINELIKAHNEANS